MFETVSDTAPACRVLEELTGPGPCSIARIVEARLQLSADRTFLISSGQRHTFRQVIEEANQTARVLYALDPVARSRVATFLTHGIASVHLMLAAHLAAKTFVSLNRPLRGALLQDQLQRVGARILATEAAAAPILQALSSLHCRVLLFVDHVPADFAAPAGCLVMSLPQYLAGVLDLPRLSRGPQPTDVASILFTSGTTGRSKAVRVTHNYLCRGAARLVECLGFTAQDVIHGWSALSHIGGQMYVVMQALISGSTVALFPTFSASRFWQEVHSVQASFIYGFPNVAKILMSTPPGESRQHRLRIALLAGITPELARGFEERFAVRMVQAYGMTEAEPLALTRVTEKEPIGCLGRAGPDFEVAIVDEHDRPLPVDAVGRIVARPKAPHVMMDGYDGDLEATREACRNNWFHTQDLGRLDADGYLYFSDRLKHAIRRRGENISSLEIETALRNHPCVAECAVVGVASPLGEQDVKAVIVLMEGSEVDARSLHTYCEANLPRYMVPRYIEFRSGLPLTETGKVRRESLDSIGAGVWDADATV